MLPRSRDTHQISCAFQQLATKFGRIFMISCGGPKTSQDALEFRCYPPFRNGSDPLASKRASHLDRGARRGSVIKLWSMLHFITDLGDAARLVPASLLLVGYLLYLRSTRAAVILVSTL